MPKALSKTLDGSKSIIALVGIFAILIAEMCGASVPNKEEILKLLGILLGVGMVHKAEKIEAAAKVFKDAIEKEAKE